MKIYLIDFENVHSEGMQGVDNLTEEDEVVIFYSQNADSISFDVLHKLMFCKAKLNYFKIRRGGKNALDFQLSTYLGYRTLTNPDAEFYIISKDAGFDFVIDFWSYGYVTAQPVIRRFVSLKSVFIWESSQKQQRNAARTHAEKAVISLINSEESEKTEESAEQPTEPETLQTEQPEQTAQTALTTAVESAAAKPAPKRRGRKPKNRPAEDNAAAVVAAEQSAPVAAEAPKADDAKPVAAVAQPPKKRGRKPKVRTEEAAAQPAAKPEMKSEIKPAAKAVKPAKAEKAVKAEKAEKAVKAEKADKVDKTEKSGGKKRGRKPGRPPMNKSPEKAKAAEKAPAPQVPAPQVKTPQVEAIPVITVDAQDQGQNNRPRRGRPPKNRNRIVVAPLIEEKVEIPAAVVTVETAAPAITVAEETAAAMPVAVEAAEASVAENPAAAVTETASEKAEANRSAGTNAVKITQTRANGGRANREPAQLTEDELDIVQGLMRTAKNRNDLYLSSLKQFGHKRGGEIYAAVKNTFSANRAKETAQNAENAENAANSQNETASANTEAGIDGDIKIQTDDE